MTENFHVGSRVLARILKNGWQKATITEIWCFQYPDYVRFNVELEGGLKCSGLPPSEIKRMD